METNSINNDIPEYSGSNIFYVLSFSKRIFPVIFSIFMGLFVLAFSLVVLFTSDSVISQLGGIGLFLMYIIAWGSTIIKSYQKIRINDDGVTMYSKLLRKLKFFKWQDIERIHIFTELFPTSKSTISFFISTNSEVEFAPINVLANSPEYMVIQNQPEIIHCIMKYYKGTIENLNLEKNWKIYISKL